MPDHGAGLRGPLPRRRSLRGALRWSLAIMLGLSVLVLGAGGGFIWYLQKEENSAFLRQHFLATISAGLGAKNALMLDEAGLKLSGTSPTFSIQGLSVENRESGARAELDRMDFRLSKTSLWRLAPEAKGVAFEGLRLFMPAAGSRGPDPVAAEALTTLRALLGGLHFAIAGQDPAFATLETIEGRDVSIYRQVEGGGIDLVQSGLTLSIQRDAQGGIAAQIQKEGRQYAFRMSARRETHSDGAGAVVIATEGVSAGSLAELLGMRPIPGIDPALALGLQITSRLEPDGRLRDIAMTLSLKAGQIRLPDPDIPPIHLDEAALALRFRLGEPEVAVDRLTVRFGETEIRVQGTLVPEGNEGALRLVLASEHAVLGRLNTSEPIARLEEARVTGLILHDLTTFRLDEFLVRAGGGDMRLVGTFSYGGEGLIETALDVRDMELRTALRIWPLMVAPPVRRWFVGHAETGRIASLSLRTRLEGAVLHSALHHGTIPDDALALTFSLANTRLRPFADAAPITLSGTGNVTGRKATASVESATIEPVAGQRLQISNARLAVADTAAHPARLDMSIPVRGPARALLAFLAAPSFNEVIGQTGGIEIAEGQFEGRAEVSIPLSDKARARDTRLEMNADLRNVQIPNVLPGEKLENGNFTVMARSGQLQAKGEARVLGLASQIEIRAEAGKPGTANAKLTVDDAILARKGYDLRPMLSGPVVASVSLPLGRQGAVPVDVELDLARAKIDNPALGISKRAGQPGKLRFSLQQRPEGAHIENIEAEIGPVTLRGRAETGRDGQLAKGEFSTLRLSPGDNARLSIERQRGVTRLTLRGNAFDIRPFLRGLQTGKADDGKGNDIEVDLQTTVLVGFNGELMGGADLRFARRQGRLTQLALKGQFSGDPVSAQVAGQSADSVLLKVDSQNAGALIRFLDIYSRVQGGRLAAEISVKAQSQSGVVTMRDFVVRGEPGLRSVVGANRAGQGLQEDIAFTKLRADFVRYPGKLQLNEAVMWGGQIGGSIEGTIDYAGDSVSLKGAFVPAYALNNLFAQVPLLGPILGGGQYEGLFAVPFVIAGRASAPVLRTNPVSAIAPGFLRKLFEIQREDPARPASTIAPSR